jgi:ribosome biogenesis GTPase
MTERDDLEGLGWDPTFAAAFHELAQPGLVPGRVALGQRGLYVVWTAEGEQSGALAGRLRHRAARPAELPAVGDWVAVAVQETTATVHAVLPRRSAFSRKLAGVTTDEQVVAANVDTLFLVCGLDEDFNPRRIECSLVLAWESGASPVLLLNKADACTDPEARLDETRLAAPSVPVHVVSALTGAGLDALAVFLERGRTVALVGSSGVGKSTLINRLMDRDVQETREVRARDGRGQHATTRRELLRLLGGALLIDTPGWRELQLWAEGDGLDRAFEDVAVLAAGCRFRDCAHGEEPGCAVRAALAPDRLRSYRKLQAELWALSARQADRRRAVGKERGRAIHKQFKQLRPQR